MTIALYVEVIALLISNQFSYVHFYSTFKEIGVFFSLLFILLYSVGLFTFLKFRKNVLSGFSLAAFSLYSIFYFSMFRNTTIEYMEIRYYRQIMIYAMFLFYIFYIMVNIFRCFRNRNKITLLRIFLLIAAEVFMYIHGMSFIIEDHGTLLAFSILFAELLSSKTILNSLKNVIVFSICVLMIMVIIVQRNNCTYNWWGVGTLADTYSASEVYMDPLLVGIHGSKNSVETLNLIYSLVEKNKREGDTLYSFPHINYFNVMADLLSPTHAKVHYFDVCSDEIAENDAEKLRENPPTFIIWMRLPEETWLLHEKIFRAGNRSGQRSLQDWFLSCLSSGNYIELGTFVVEDSDPIMVYGINDGRVWKL